MKMNRTTARATNILRRVNITLTHILLLAVVAGLAATYHQLVLIDQDIENQVEFSQQLVDTQREITGLPELGAVAHDGNGEVSGSGSGSVSMSEHESASQPSLKPSRK